MRLILRWIIAAFAIWATLHVIAAINPDWGQWTARTLWAPLLAAVVMGLVNALIRPVVKLLTLPLNCLTFGLFAVIINALMFWLVGAVTEAFRVNFIGAVLGALIMGVIQGVASKFILAGDEADQRRGRR